MTDEFAKNPWQPQQSAQAQSAMPSIAPPPVEVSIRTMASDLASLGETGGGPPRPMNVAVPSLTRIENQTRSAQIPDATAVEGSRPGPKLFILVFIAVFGAVGLFLGGYYLLPLLSSSEDGNQLLPSVRATSTIASSSPSVPTGPAVEHRSVFLQTVNGVFMLGIATSTEGFQPYNINVNAIIAGISSSTPGFFDASPQNTKGEPLSAPNFLDSINANVFGQNFLTSNFNSDFTLFFYKEKKDPPADQAALWPGYVFQLAQNKSPILLQQDVRKIENASNLENLFLNDPGVPEGQFKDALVSGQPVRTANFSDKKSIIVYGWFFNKYLIVSTSLEGLAQALAHF